MGLISRVSSRTYRQNTFLTPQTPLILTKPSTNMSRSYSRSRSRSPVARKSRSRSPARRQEKREERSRSREASPEKIMYSIVVSDLPADIRESELERKFEQFGKIGDVFMPKDRYSGKGRGFAFVRFFEKADQEDCIDAVKKEPIHFGGPDCRVDFAKTKPRPGTEDWDPEKAAQIRRDRSDRQNGGGGRDDRYDRRGGGFSERRDSRGDDRRGGGRDDRRGGGAYRRSPSPYRRSNRSPS